MRKAFFLFGKLGLNVNRALQTLALDLATDLVRRANISIKKFSIGMTTAAAEEFRPTIAAFGFIKYVRLPKIFQPMPFILRYAVENISEPIIFAPNELMTRIKVSILRNGKIFVPRAATR